MKTFNCRNQNKKLLEQLEEQKKRLRIQNQQSGFASSSASTGSLVPVAAVSSNSELTTEAQQMNSSQKAALKHAHANSVGYFITQDSAFGNLILPVLPRFEK